ncbi:MAG: tRNA1(Val) (adenine(37)-N6)-methyltransferase [Streptococcaceae bacterium]|jgi:tRNA1(Val) A37 N6-methylase TrmN6|nr:tRNA1(Val) (adenine(37)-N6)-methyltransferase [Streptococcaceae bacterium]
MINLLKGERIDQFYNEDVKIIQNPKVFSYSVDSVLLAHFPNLPKKGLIVDMCAGNGAVGLFASKYTKAPIVQIEIQELLADMGRRSIELNGLQEQMIMYNLDLKEANTVLKHDSVDLLMVNPPYFKMQEKSQKNPNPHLAIARHEIMATLDDVVKMSSFLLKTNGRLAMVHRPDRLMDILETFKQYKIAPKKIRFVYPKMEKEANMVLIEGIYQGSMDGLKILPPLYVHKEDGSYTKELEKIYYGR